MALTARITLVALLLAAAPRPSSALDPYTINVMLSMTGSGTFIGNAQWRSIQALEGVVNRRGGIGGRPVKFVLEDDQSSPQVAVQLMQSLMASHVSVVLGPSLAASCNAMAPLTQSGGPVLYCLTSGVHPPAGSFVFSTLTSTPDMIERAMTYFSRRGLKRVAYIATTDASGQDAEQGVLGAANVRSDAIAIVDAEHFAVADISVSAQMARIKGSNPDVVVAWVNGAAAGTVLRGYADSGISAPMMLSNGNLTPAFISQYGRLFPKDLFMPAMAYYAGNEVTDRATRSALDTMVDAFRRSDAKPDQLALCAWDPPMIIVDALRRLGPDVSATALRDYLLALRGWTGANGPYDFRAVPQRGLAGDSIVMVQWDRDKAAFHPVSKLGGKPL